MIRRPTDSTRTDTRLPATTPFRSVSRVPCVLFLLLLGGRSAPCTFGQMMTRGVEIDHLGNVGRVIANTFDVLGDEKQMRGFRNMLRMFHHISDDPPKNSVVKVVDHLVATAYRCGEISYARGEGIQHVMPPFRGTMCQGRQPDEHRRATGRTRQVTQ